MFILFGDALEPLFVVPSLPTEMVEEDSNGQRDDDVELLRSFETSQRTPKSESVCESYHQNRLAAEICFSVKLGRSV